MNAICVAIVCAITLLPFAVYGANVGDSCQVARSGATGVCAIITDCQPVIDEIVNQGLFPAQCGFRGREQIVCCPVKMVTTTTTTPAPTRISQQSKWLNMNQLCHNHNVLFVYFHLECRQYEDAKYERVWTSVGYNEKPILEKILRCGSSNVPLVVGGEVANLGEFPHMVNWDQQLFRFRIHSGGSETVTWMLFECQFSLFYSCVYSSLHRRSSVTSETLIRILFGVAVAH